MTKKQKKMVIRILISACLMIGLHFVDAEIYVMFALYMVPYLIIGYDILRKAAKGVVNGQVFDENFLMAIATIGAIVLAALGEGDFTEAVAVMLFYQIGELFQSYAVGKSRRSIGALMDIRPDVAHIERNGEILTLDPEEIAVGDTIIVRPGERIPIDGVIVEGATELDTRALTGESIPRAATSGDAIFSGAINLTGVIRIRTTKAFSDSTVSKILELVENASSRKSRSEAFISRFAKYYTPAVCIGALALALLPPIVSLGIGGAANFTDWLYRSLSFLVVSCPCALVISIPLTFFAGIGGASRAGILVKGSNYLEALADTKVVMFDKTGTLTEGAFEVSEICASVGFSREEILEYAAYAEGATTHPVGKSIVRAYGKSIDATRISGIREIAGAGVACVLDGREVLVGNSKLMSGYGVKYKDCGEVGTVAHVAVSGKYSGYIVISDKIKESSRDAIGALRKIGVSKTVMLTGDAQRIASKVASELGIDSYQSELLPGDKVAAVERELAEVGAKGKVAFVGDGINDAPVLSRTDIGIAMGAVGSDAAIEAADIVIMDDDPMKIALSVKMARRCMRIVYQNIIFAIGIKLICLLLVAVGVAGMWLAVFADVGVMVLAVLNAIRALFVKK